MLNSNYSSSCLRKPQFKAIVRQFSHLNFEKIRQTKVNIT